MIYRAGHAGARNLTTSKSDSRALRSFDCSAEDHYDSLRAEKIPEMSDFSHFAPLLYVFTLYEGQKSDASKQEPDI
jgi:hypothetical protein